MLAPATTKALQQCQNGVPQQDGISAVKIFFWNLFFIKLITVFVEKLYVKPFVKKNSWSHAFPESLYASQRFIHSFLSDNCDMKFSSEFQFET